jgi:BirA family biotin operon repressor/biotin-[acetyl-CoA-carboxylase] ligase
MKQEKNLFYQLLKHFFFAPGEFLSGEFLSSHLKVSRVTIWKAIAALKSDGFEFEAISNKGYRLLRPPVTLHRDWLRLHLEKTGIAGSLYFFETIDSTNTEGLRLLANGVDVPAVLVAKTMTAGRGRLGRSWVASDLGNLYISFIFRPKKSLSALSALSLWVGLAVCRAFEDYFKIDLKIKWPNDLCVGHKKIAGILMESTIDLDSVEHLVLGIGFNVNTYIDNWPLDIKNKATTLERVLNRPVCLFQAATVLIKSVFKAYDDYMSGAYESVLNAAWPKYDLFFNQKVIFEKNQQVYSGVACGVDAKGFLKIQLDSSEIVFLNAGEVSLALNYGAAL